MNVLNGKIVSVKTHGNLSLVQIAIGDVVVKSIVIETPESADYLQPDHPVQVLFKESEVAVGRESAYEVSLQSRFPCIIVEIERGVLLSRITMSMQETSIRAIITSHAVDQLALQTGEEVIAMIKTNEMMLSS